MSDLLCFPGYFARKFYSLQALQPYEDIKYGEKDSVLKMCYHAIADQFYS